MRLTRCVLCNDLCLENVGVCSECLRAIGDGIRIGIAVLIVLAVAAVTWITVRFYR